MAKEKSVAVSPAYRSWIAEIFHVGMYKRSQGKVARQATFGAIGVTVALAAYQLSVFLTAKVLGTVESLLSTWPLSYISEGGRDVTLQVAEVLSLEYSLPLLLFAVGLWIGFRVVNIPRFADFLISVEAEMNKVSWPSKDELIRSSIVVIFVIVAMSALLYGYDAFWTLIFGNKVLGILHTS